MKMLLIVIALILGFVIGVWYGHWIWRKPILMVVDQHFKVIPHVDPGDRLVWTDQTASIAAPTAIDFKYGNGKVLCEPPSGGRSTEQNIHECIVRKGIDQTAGFRFYTYQCEPASACADPDAGGGSDPIGTMGSQTSQGSAQTPAAAPAVAAAAAAVPTQINVYCNGTAMADPPTLQASPGQTIQWEPQGTVGSKWSVGASTDQSAGSLSPVCGNGHSSFSDASICTVQPGAPGSTVTTTYNVTAQACNAGTAQITVSTPMIAAGRK